jgi:hypothetical protein
VHGGALELAQALQLCVLRLRPHAGGVDQDVGVIEKLFASLEVDGLDFPQARLVLPSCADDLDVEARVVVDVGLFGQVANIGSAVWPRMLSEPWIDMHRIPAPGDWK